MSSREWIKEPESGRWYVPGHDKHGRATRQYEDDSGRHASSRPLQPSTREGYEIPRSEAQARNTRRASTYITSPSTARRGSVSSGRPEPTRHGERGDTQPVAVHHKNPSKYHEGSGHEPRRAEPRYEDADVRGYPSSSKDSHVYEIEGAARHMTTEPIGFSQTTVDGDLSTAVNALSITDFTEGPEYNFVSASAPASHNHWPGIYREKSNQNTLTPTSQNDALQPLPHKGKGIVDNSHDEQSSFYTGPRYIVGTAGETEKLDPSYKKRNHDYLKFFQPGRVFSTLWTDSFAGDVTESENNQFMSAISYVKYNERVHTKIRRFIVVRQIDRACICLPVTTYDGKGYRKGGINLREHGLIYSGEKEPRYVQGITKEPLKVKLSKGATKLSSTSYINYARLYTIECNVKVKDVGELDLRSLRYLKKYYNEIHHAPDEEDLISSVRPTGQSKHEIAGFGAGISDRSGYIPQETSHLGYSDSRSSMGAPQYSVPYPDQRSFNPGFSGNAQYPPSQGHPTGPYPTEPRYGASYHSMPGPHTQYAPEYDPTSSRDSGSYPSHAHGSASFPAAQYADHGNQSHGSYSYDTNIPGTSSYDGRNTSQQQIRDHGYAPTYGNSTPQVPYQAHAYEPGYSQPPPQDTTMNPRSPSFSYPRARVISDPVFEEKDDDEQIELPTIEEARAAKERRMSVTSGRSHHSRREREPTRDRGGDDRSRGYERDRERDRDRDRHRGKDPKERR